MHWFKLYPTRSDILSEKGLWIDRMSATFFITSTVIKHQDERGNSSEQQEVSMDKKVRETAKSSSKDPSRRGKSGSFLLYSRDQRNRDRIGQRMIVNGRSDTLRWRNAKRCDPRYSIDSKGTLNVGPTTINNQQEKNIEHTWYLIDWRK